jgi:membrane-bound ClpP family serine protease
MLIFVGLGLLAFEIFVFPGTFIAGVIGILMIVGGLIMTFVGSEPGSPGVLPSMSGTVAAIQRGLLVVTLGLISSLLLWTWLARYLPKIPYFNRLVLVTPGGDPTMMGALGADIVWPLVGQIGKTVTDLKPGGSAEFRDETVNDNRPVSVVTECGFIRAGTDVVVTESRGSRIVVRPVGV